MRPVLVTIPFSHYCEKARWALERGGVEFVEAGHLPMFSRLATARRGRWSSVPLLATDDGVIDDSTAIVQWVGRRGGRFNPYPTSGTGDALDLEERFDQRLGPHTRRVAYGWVLEDRSLLRQMIEDAAVPAAEKACAAAALPAMIAVIRRSLKVDAAGVARSTERVDEAFAAVADRLADGRRYLCGDALSAADLTFAALAAPVLAPPNHGAPLPAVERLPAAGQATGARLRAHPAGAFAMRLYAEDRRRS